MPSTPTPSPSPALLRERAEERLRGNRNGHGSPAAKAKSGADASRLLHELQVHQIELEMQNEELRKTRDAMEAGLEKYADLYDFAPIGYLTLDSEGAILESNLAAATLLGIPRGPLMQQRFGFFVDPADRPGFNAFFQQVFKGNARENRDVKLLVKDKAPVYVRIRGNRFESGKACRLALADVTAQREADEKVRVSEIRYRRLFEAAHDGVLLLDPESRKITDANPFMTKLLGYSRDDLVGKELYEIGLLQDEAASREMFRKLKLKHEIRYEDLPLEAKGGRYQEVEVVANVYQENGRAVIQCNIRDITERKNAENVLRRNEALFSALIEQAPVGIYVVDSGLHMLQVNPTARPIFATIRPLIGRGLSEVLHVLWPAKVAAEAMDHFRHTLKTGQPYYSTDFSERRRDLGLTESYEWQLQQITLPAGDRGVVCFFDDVTERKQSEAIKLRAELLTVENREANREIARRRIVESTLRTSERTQRDLLVESRELHAQLRLLTRQIITAQEEERKAISRELHDEVMQILVGVHVELSALAKGAPAYAKLLKKNIARTQRLVVGSVNAIHNFARGLRPASLDDLGLIPALHAFCKGLAGRKKLKIHLTAFRGVEALDGPGRIVLFRVAQEALTNVTRHARASQVYVDISPRPGMIRMDIRDDGKSFGVVKTLSARNPKRLGLVGMRERMEMVGGSLAIDSAPGRGTTVRAEIPYNPKKKKYETRKANYSPTR